MRKAAISTLVATCLLAIASTLFLVVATSVGWKIGTVVSGSMEPDMGVGQMAIAKPINPEALEEGDIIAFRSPHNPDSLITHRVIDILETEDALRFRTKGDANNGPDDFIVPAENVEGKIVFHMPYLGYLIRFSQTSVGMVTLAAVGTVLLVIAWILGVRGPEIRVTRRSQGEPTAARQR